MRNAQLAALVLLAACAPADRAEDTGAASIRPETPAPTESSSLVLERGGSVILTERVTRTAERMESELTAGPSEGRVTYTAALNPDGTVSRLDARLYEAGTTPQSAPAGRVAVTLRGDSALLELAEGDSTQRAQIAVARGTIPIPVSEAVGMVEQLLRRARAIGGTTAEIPTLIVEKGVRTGTATVTFTGRDSARVVVRGDGSSTEMHVATDAAGHLLGARVPASGLVIRRMLAP